MDDQREARLQPLLSSTTIDQALETAMAFEHSAHRLYISLAATLRAELRPLLEELAAEELEHYRLLSELARDEQCAALVSSKITAPTSTDRFATYVNLPRLPTDPLDDDILEYARDRERVAFEHYAHLAELAPDGPVRDLFRFLRDEERKHEQQLETRWATTFSVF
jgi:rubrerythrin